MPYAETSDHRRAASPAAGAQSVTRAIADEVRNVPFPFNESERSQQMQWHYNNTGNIFAQTSQLGADANVYAAWQLSTGNPDVIVAVVDQGVKYDHEDLAANMWVNEAELNGTPGVDDDGNGYVDDIYGYNFTKETGELDFSAELMHGTHVAGTIGRSFHSPSFCFFPYLSATFSVYPIHVPNSRKKCLDTNHVIL